MFSPIRPFLSKQAFFAAAAAAGAALLLSSCGSGSRVPVALEVSTAVASTAEGGTTSSIFNGINAYRLERGLSAQRRHSGLDRMAQLHAMKMARTGKFVHSNIEYAEETARRRCNLFNVEENILKASRLTEAQLPAVAMEGWINSRGHRINLETQNTHVGLGVAEAPDGTFYAVAITASNYKGGINEVAVPRSYGNKEGSFKGINW